MQRPSQRFRGSEGYFVYEISEESFTQIYGDLYGTMLVLIRMGSNKADGNQQKHLLPSFAIKAGIHSSKNS